MVALTVNDSHFSAIELPGIRLFFRLTGKRGRMGNQTQASPHIDRKFARFCPMSFHSRDIADILVEALSMNFFLSDIEMIKRVMLLPSNVGSSSSGVEINLV